MTPPGAAAIAVVRLSGPGVAPFLARHFSRPARAGRCVHGELRDAAGEVIDDPVVVLLDEGQVADVNLHGGPWVVASVIELARAAGFEVTDGSAGPLPEVAVDADDPLTREVVQHLPLARTEAALRALLAQPAAWAGMLARPPAPEEVGRVLADRGLWWLLHPPRVAIVGVPNVGKSTLANQLFAQERSIVADLPGTTRDWVGEVANVDGLAVTLVDTPGIRETVDDIERRAIERSGEVVAGADLVLVVLDASRPAVQQRALPQAHSDAIVVLNKYDLLPSAPDASSAFLRDAGWAGAFVRTTATTGAGISELRRAIRERFGLAEAATGRPRWWTPRQRDFLAALLSDPATGH